MALEVFGSYCRAWALWFKLQGLSTLSHRVEFLPYVGLDSRWIALGTSSEVLARNFPNLVFVTVLCRRGEGMYYLKCLVLPLLKPGCRLGSYRPSQKWTEYL